MGHARQLGLTILAGLLLAIPLAAQNRTLRTERRPPAIAPAGADSTQPKTPDGSGAAYILDGMPMLLELHHDTEVGTNKPIDVFVLVIELQVMNSDGNLEPEGLQIFNYYTRYVQDPQNAFNRFDARDCRTWFYLQNHALKQRKSKTKGTWPYIELTTLVGARTVQTNEDGQVYWSDDIQCWGSSDRFPPF